MSYSYSVDNLDEIVYGNNSCLKDKISLNAKYHEITNDISLIKLNVKANEDVKVHVKNLNQEFFTIGYLFDGHIKFTDFSSKKSLIYGKNETILTSPSLISGNSEYKKDEDIVGLEINLSKKLIKQIAPFLIEDEKLKRYITTNPKTKILAQEVYSCPFCGELEKFYLQSKIYEIIYLNLSSLNKPKSNTKVVFSDYDIQALKEAKTILENSFENPPTIIQLSKMVRLNEFKLKYGMKKYLNTTPYQISLYARLHHAKKLLISGDFNVNEVSKKVGYKQVQNFSRTFTKYFGIHPKSFKKDVSYHF